MKLTAHRRVRNLRCHVKAKCYERKSFNVRVTNPTNKRTTFAVTVNEVSATDAALAGDRELTPAQRSLRSETSVPVKAIPKCAW
jgi:hypothetical protein